MLYLLDFVFDTEFSLGLLSLAFIVYMFPPFWSERWNCPAAIDKYSIIGIQISDMPNG